MYLVISLALDDIVIIGVDAHFVITFFFTFFSSLNKAQILAHNLVTCKAII